MLQPRRAQRGRHRIPRKHGRERTAGQVPADDPRWERPSSAGAPRVWQHAASDADRCRRRIRAGQPRPGRLGLVHRRGPLGQRRVAARHQQHGRTHSRTRPAAPDSRGCGRPAGVLRLAIRDQFDHHLDAELEAQGMAQGRRQSGAQCRDHEGTRQRHAGTPSAVRVGEGPCRASPQRGCRPFGQRRRGRLRPRSAGGRRPRLRRTDPQPGPGPACPPRPRPTTCSPASTSGTGRGRRPTRNGWSTWSGPC